MTSKPSYTPGEWRVEVEAEPDEADRPETYIVHPDTVCTATVVCTLGWSGSFDEAELRSNANLISAAPECHHCTDLLESLCAWLLHRFGPDSPEGKEAQFRLTAASAALAKAEGREL